MTNPKLAEERFRNMIVGAFEMNRCSSILLRQDRRIENRLKLYGRNYFRRGFIKLLLTKYYIKRKKWYLINSQLLFFSFSNNWKTRLIVLRDLEQYFVLVAVTVGISYPTLARFEESR